MIRVLLTLTALALILAVPGHAAAPGSSAACSVSPSPAAVGATVVVTAAGVPLIAPTYLIVTRSDGTSFYGDTDGGFGNSTYVAPDGSSTSPIVLDQAGSWTFTYSSMVKDRGKYRYEAVAVCASAAA